MQSKAKSVPQYIAEFDGEKKSALVQLRAMVKDAAPRAKESMQYGMPVYHLDGEPFVAFASQKQYFSLYVDVDLLKRRAKEFPGLNIGKCCIRFRKLEDLPLDAAARLIRDSAEIITKKQ